MSSEVLDELGRLVGDDGAYFVGGVRPRRPLGRPVTDVDVVVAGDPATAARRLARETGGSPFALSEAPRGVARRARRPHARHHRAARGRYPGRPGRARLHRERDGDPGRRRRRCERRRPVRRPRRPGGGPTAPRLATGSSPTTRSGCCASPGSRTSSEFEVDPDAERLARRDAHLADRPAGERIYAEVRRLLGARPSRRRRPPARRARRARRDPARGRPDARLRAEPVPPPGRLRAHAPGARRLRRHRRAPRALPAAPRRVAARRARPDRRRRARRAHRAQARRAVPRHREAEHAHRLG